MKRLFTLLILLVTVQLANSQVTIPDPNFVTYLQTWYPELMNGDQLDTLLAADPVYDVTNCANSNITDVTGIQYFKSMTEFYCYYNQITFLPKLPPKLKNFRCDGNKITSLPSDLPATLEYLECGSNKLTSLPANLPASLIQLNCQDNQLTSLPTLPDGIQYLYCSSNNLTSVPVLPSALLGLNCGHNLLTTLPALPSKLMDLDCQYSGALTTLPALPNSLVTLACQYCKITLLPSIPSATKTIYAQGNLISSMPDLTNADSLITFYIFDNKIPGVFPDMPAKLKYLSCYKNLLTGFSNVSPVLQRFECSNNKISALPNLPNTLLYLTCGNNPLTALPALAATAIATLECSYCNLTSLPVLPATLGSLGCNYNSLSSLPPLAHTKVNTLICKNNQLASIPPLPSTINLLSADHNLIHTTPAVPSNMGSGAGFFFSYNQLTTVTNLPDSSLCSFDVSYNPLLKCLPPMKAIVDCQGWGFHIEGTDIHCLPNRIQHPATVNSYGKILDTMRLCDGSDCIAAWNIEGAVWHDADNNCSTTANEPLLPNIKMSLLDKQDNLLQQVYASGGRYSFDTNLDTFLVSADTANIPFTIHCPSNNLLTSIVSAADSFDNNVDFRLACKPGFDVGVNSILSLGRRFFPGNTSAIALHAGDFAKAFNVSCNTSGLTGTITVTFDGPVTYTGVLVGTKAPSSVNGNTLTWNISDFSALNFNNDFSFNLKTNTTAQSGDKVCVQVVVTPSTAGDNNISNNTMKQCFTVVNSYDPNEKEVSPAGSLAFPYNDWLTYTIYFQNTGTAAAQNIVLRDTLDANLDWRTFQLLSWSHSVTTQLTSDGIVKFIFPVINLPSSKTSEPLSHGYVQYRIMPKPSLPVNTSIANKASIYFDFNSPIITNTVTNNIEVETGVKSLNENFNFVLYPNPTTGMLQLADYGLGSEAEVIISDMPGRILLSKEISADAISLDVSTLSGGIYFVTLRNKNGMVVKRFVKE